MIEATLRALDSESERGSNSCLVWIVSAGTGIQAVKVQAMESSGTTVVDALEGFNQPQLRYIIINFTIDALD